MVPLPVRLNLRYPMKELAGLWCRIGVAEREGVAGYLLGILGCLKFLQTPLGHSGVVQHYGGTFTLE